MAQEKEEVGQGFKVKIPRLIYDQVMHWVHKAGKNEVSGFGTVEYDHETKTFVVRKAVLLKQENGGAETEIDGAALSKAMYELRNEPGEIRWWWHSHVQMNVFWSGTDMTTIRQLGGNGWILATVFNQRYEYRSALLTHAESPLTPKIEYFVDQIPTHVISYYDQSLFDEWDKEFQEKVQEKKWTPSYFQGGVGRSGRNAADEYTVGDAQVEKWAKDEFGYSTSEYFTKDARFFWRKGHTDESNKWVTGEWVVCTAFADRAESIVKNKIEDIKRSLVRWGTNDLMDGYGYPM